MKRNRRAGVEDRWTKTVRDEHGNEKKVPSARHGQGTRWMARYVDDEGHERSKSFDRKADAQIWLDSDVTVKLATGTYVAPKAGLITIDEIHSSWSATQVHLAPKTAASRSSTWTTHVQPKWGRVSVVDVKTAGIRAWVAKMVADEVGVPTIHKAYAQLRQLLGAAVEEHRIPRNPCEGVKLPKMTPHECGYLSPTQVATLADEVTWLPEVIRFLAYTGLRWGEMAALRVQDFDMLRRRVSISRVGHREREAGMGPAQDRREALGAVPGSAVRGAGGADGRQGPRGSSVHRHARRGAAGRQLPQPILQQGRRAVPEGRRDVP